MRAKSPNGKCFHKIFHIIPVYFLIRHLSIRWLLLLYRNVNCEQSTQWSCSICISTSIILYKLLIDYSWIVTKEWKVDLE